MRELTVAAGVGSGLVEFAVSKGACRKALLDRAGLVSADLEDQDDRIPFLNYVALMRAAKVLCRDPAFALHFGASVDISQISIVGLMDHGIETMADAFVHINHYASLIIETGGRNPERLAARHVGREVRIVDTRPNPDAFPELTESTFSRIVCGWRRFSGDSRELRAVHVTHARPAHHAAYRRVFQAPTVFGSDCNALVWDASWWSRRLVSESSYVSRILGHHADRLLGELEKSKSMKGRVKSLLLPRLDGGDTSMAAVAAELGLTRATLRRRLQAESVTFAGLLDELRCEVAIEYLNAGHHSVNQIAYRLGFSDPAPFSRAFKRWTGRSPSAFARDASEREGTR
jgi:AraC-like DNA-binding protein